MIRLPGFHPINAHVWHRHTGERPWTPTETLGVPLWRWRLRVLRGHRR